MSGSGPITFSYSDWVLAFPAMAGVAQPMATTYFLIASKYVANPNPYVSDPAMLTTLLYLTTAHVAFLLSPQTNGLPTTGGTSPPSSIVGRINSATEGSVSVGTDFGTQPANAAWWQQTQYGAMAWQMLKPFRLMRFVPGPRRIFNPPVRGLWGTGW